MIPRAPRDKFGRAAISIGVSSTGLGVVASDTARATVGVAPSCTCGVVGVAPREIAVLYPDGSTGLAFQSALKTLHIPFDVRGPEICGRARLRGCLITRIAEQSCALRAPSENAVVLSTVHSAKELEWDAVFVVGLEEGAMPSAGAEIEEERRVA